MKKIDKITKEFLIKKITDKWIRENNRMMKDLEELAWKMQMFSIDWGIKFRVEVDDNEPAGRDLGVSAIEELFEAQKEVKKSKT